MDYIKTASKISGRLILTSSSESATGAALIQAIILIVFMKVTMLLSGSAAMVVVWCNWTMEPVHWEAIYPVNQTIKASAANLWMLLLPTATRGFGWPRVTGWTILILKPGCLRCFRKKTGYVAIRSIRWKKMPTANYGWAPAMGWAVMIHTPMSLPIIQRTMGLSTRNITGMEQLHYPMAGYWWEEQKGLMW